MPLGLPNPLAQPTAGQRAKRWLKAKLPIILLFCTAAACSVLAVRVAVVGVFAGMPPA